MKHSQKARIWDTRNGKYIEAMVFLEIDLYALAVELGGKALKNKSGKTRIVGGLVKCIEVRPQQ